MNSLKKLTQIRLSRYLSYFLFFYITVFFQFSAIADDEYYFMYDAGELYEEASLCENYIRNNNVMFVAQIKAITYQYKAKSFLKANDFIESKDFIDYKNSLWNCSLYIKYTGEVNYFREAYTYLYKLIIDVEQANEVGVYDLKEMDKVEISIIGSIDKILLSKKIIKNRSQRKKWQAY